MLAVTFWFDPALHRGSYPLVMRFRGRRVGATGRLQDSDRFVHDEVVDDQFAVTGPVSVTAKVPGVEAGEWEVNAHLLPSSASKSGKRRDPRPLPIPVHRAQWSWRKWKMSEAAPAPVETCLAPLSYAPGTTPLAWALTAVAGMAIGLTLQALIIRWDHLHIGSALTLSLIALAVGVVAAKAWYVVLHSRERRWDGWAIQGLLTGLVVTVTGAWLLSDILVGAFLDASAPGLLIGMAVGRVGCLFAGCCYGRPTCSRWGLWSSDRRIGARRVPTQPMETALGLVVGGAALAAVVLHGPAHGTIFVAALAAHTFARQGILRWRAEARQTALGPRLVAVVAAGISLAAVVTAALTG